jgi:hypothetical protein
MKIKERKTDRRPSKVGIEEKIERRKRRKDRKRREERNS